MNKLSDNLRKSSDNIMALIDKSFETGKACGRNELKQDISCVNETLKANISNEKLSDAEFRDFVKTIAERFDELTDK